MIINAKISKCRDGICEHAQISVEVNSSWYTVQNYFNDNLKEEFLQSDNDTIVIGWQNKIYEFKRKKNGDKRRETGRKKRGTKLKQGSPNGETSV